MARVATEAAEAGSVERVLQHIQQLEVQASEREPDQMLRMWQWAGHINGSEWRQRLGMESTRLAMRRSRQQRVIALEAGGEHGGAGGRRGLVEQGWYSSEVGRR